MEHALRVFVGMFTALGGLFGLFVTSRAQDDGMATFGFLLFLFGILLNFWLIKRHFDAIAQDCTPPT
jgi:hypothetical protein